MNRLTHISFGISRCTSVVFALLQPCSTATTVALGTTKPRHEDGVSMGKDRYSGTVFALRLYSETGVGRTATRLILYSLAGVIRLAGRSTVGIRWLLTVRLGGLVRLVGVGGCRLVAVE